MPRLTGIREVRFVTPTIVDGKATYTDDRPDVVKVEIVDDPIQVEYFKEFFERGLVKARDQVRLCQDLGSHRAPGGCLAKYAGLPEPICEAWLASLESCRYSDERQTLVRIYIEYPKETP